MKLIYDKDKNEDNKTPIGQSHTRGPNGLTYKQEKMCQLIANGETILGAYRAAGYTGGRGDRKRESRHAWEIMNKPKIKERIDKLRQDMEKVKAHDPQELREFVLGRLLCEAEKADNSSSRIRALELLGKVSDVGLFVERVDQRTEIRSPETVEAELKQRLNAIRARN